MHTETYGMHFFGEISPGYPLVMDMFEQGCCALPGNSQNVISVSSSQSYMCQAAGPHDLCVSVSCRSPRVCSCCKTPALQPSTSPAAWDAAADPGQWHREEETFLRIP